MSILGGWFGLSPAEPEDKSRGTQRTGRGLVSRGQAISAAQQPPAPQPIDRREPEAVVIRDLHPADDSNTYHTLGDFCTYNPGTAPGTMDLCFFGGESFTSRVTRWTGILSRFMGRASNGEFSHVGVAYVGQDRQLALFEAVHGTDTLRDILTDTVGRPGVRLVKLSERVIRYARSGECFRELPNGDRVVRVGVMQFRMPGVPPEQHAAVMSEICRRFDAFQDRLKGVGYTGSFKELCEAQLPQLFGTGAVGASDTPTYCSKLACMAYQAANILADPEFNPAKETPSTLAARTLPVRSFFSLGPELYLIYVCVKRIEWDTELQLAVANQRRQQEAALAAAAMFQGHATQQHQQHHHQQPLPTQQWRADPPQRADAVRHAPQSLEEFVAEDSNAFADYEERDPSDHDQTQIMERLWQRHPPGSEVFRMQGEMAHIDQENPHTLQGESSPAPPYRLPPPPPPQPPDVLHVLRPSRSQEDLTIAWLNGSK